MLGNQLRSRLLLRRLNGAFAASLLGVVLAGLPARADVPLRRADVESLLNRVELLPRGRTSRPARLSDFLGLGDGLRTASSSRAELRFNDDSLARIGERATFHFVPNTRNFRLSNGTVLLLIPPGRGRTNIQTPNAVTGIQGSALAVRYNEATQMTLVLALTNNPAGPMTVTTADGANEAVIYAGQIALVQGNDIQVMEFDMDAFYRTSDLTEGLDPRDPDAAENLSGPLSQVLEEMAQALPGQFPFAEADDPVINPAVLSLDSNSSTLAQVGLLLSPPGVVTTSNAPRPNNLVVVQPTGTLGRQPTPSPTLPSSGGGVSQPPVGAQPQPSLPTTGGGEAPSSPVVPATPVTGGGGTPTVPTAPTPQPPSVPVSPNPTPVSPPTGGGGTPTVPTAPTPQPPSVPVSPNPTPVPEPGISFPPKDTLPETVPPTPSTPAPVPTVPDTVAPVGGGGGGAPAPAEPVSPAPTPVDNAPGNSGGGFTPPGQLNETPGSTPGQGGQPPGQTDNPTNVPGVTPGQSGNDPANANGGGTTQSPVVGGGGSAGVSFPDKTGL